jgi:N-formylglutamate amidohydrolase
MWLSVVALFDVVNRVVDSASRFQFLQSILLMFRFYFLVFVSLFGSTSCLSQEKATKNPSAGVVFTQLGELPIVLSAPHGGTKQLLKVPERKGEGMKTGGAGFVTMLDAGTEELAQAVSDSLEKRFGKKPYMVVSRVHRKYVDFNRPPEIAYENEGAKPTYDYYHEKLVEYCKEVTAKFRTGVLLDIHGQSEKADTVFRGTRNGTTVKHLQERFGKEAFIGPRSLFAMLERNTWIVHPKPFDGKEANSFSGGHIVGTYGALHGAIIDAYQLEFGRDYRTKERRAQTAAQLTEALAEYSDAYLKLAPAKKAASTATKKIRIAVYNDDGVMSIETLLSVLHSNDKFEIKTVKAEQIRQGVLADFDVLIKPGGTGAGQGKALGPDGREKIREFVGGGKGMLGICAGAYLATCDYSWSLNLLDAKVLDKNHWNRGSATIALALSPSGRKLLTAKDPSASLYCHQGPLLAPAGKSDVPDYEELGKFVGEVAKNGAPTGVMPGTTAIARGHFEKGRVFAFSPHPEKSQGFENFVFEAIEWLAEAE